ncbi:MAG: right-handed parallel beta-helix repeat-containing protein [Candidatus Thermoplasmatota archaeon]|nr:right-handed parallel beta-helix repeat-containing protein [Candidatus Thermoplasmatota archaeon]
MKKEISTIIIVSILLSALCTLSFGIEASGSIYYADSELEGNLLENVTIKSDDELEDFVESEEVSGNGSEEAPYELVNYTIDGMGENHSVYLENIDQHFTIKDCKIFNSSESAIKIKAVSNFTLENSVVKNSTYGVNIESSHHITVRGCSVQNTTDNGVGVNIKSSENITIKGSKIYNNTAQGIYLESAHNNTIINNNISNNHIGVRFSESNSNLIYHNIFFKNGIQASDNGDNRWDDGRESGNYWENYEEEYPDANESINKGIWNKPYEIGENNSDRYPLISPIGPPTNFRARPVRDEYVEITWNPPQYSIRYPVEEIILYRSEERNNLSLSESVYEKMNSSVQVFRDENITEGEEYHYGLRASNGKYVSVMSEDDSAEPDTDRPEIENRYPRVGAEEVPINATIEVEFDEEMDEDSISISVEDAEGEEVEGELYGEGTEFIFAPKENLSYDTTYEVTVNGSDIAKNWMESPYTWSFTTVPDTGTIIGRVVNEEGEPLENVKIFVDDEHQTFTDSSGEFQIEVPSGNITLKISRDGYEDKERKYHINQGEENEIEDIMLKEREGIISTWFWPMALVGGAILFLGIVALVIFFYRWEKEEPPLDEDIYDEDYEDITAEEFESWWEDEDS